MARGASRLLAGLVLWTIAACAIAQGISKASIELSLPQASRDLPDEIDAMAAQLKELSPGLWESNRGMLFLALTVGNRSDQPLPLSSFGLQLGDGLRSDSVLFDCSPERNQPAAALSPRGQAAYLCRAGMPPTGTRAIVVGHVATLRLDPQAASIQWREPAPRPVARRPSPQQEAAARAAARPTAPIKVVSDPPPRRISSFEDSLFTSTKLLYLLFVVLAICYCGAAKLIGNLQAAIFFWLLGTAYVGTLMTRLGAGGSRLDMVAVLIYVVMLCGAVGLAVVYHSLYKFLETDWETLKKRIVYLLLGMIAFALLVLLDRMGF